MGSENVYGYLHRGKCRPANREIDYCEKSRLRLAGGALLLEAVVVLITSADAREVVA
jgi:hypothetical protein